MTPTQTVCTLEETHTGKTWAMVTFSIDGITTHYLCIVGTLLYFFSLYISRFCQKACGKSMMLADVGQCLRYLATVFSWFHGVI